MEIPPPRDFFCNTQVLVLKTLYHLVTKHQYLLTRDIGVSSNLIGSLSGVNEQLFLEGTCALDMGCIGLYWVQP